MKNLKFLWLLLPSLFFSSCYSYDDLDMAEDQLVSVTQYDTQCNFSQFNTFAISDSIISISSSGDSIVGTKTLTTTGKSAADEVRKNMTSRGYTEVDPTHVTPDLHIALYSLEVLNVTTYYPGWWWGYYDPYYYWGWYPYSYPYYYPYSYGVTTGYAVGSLIIQVNDLKNIQNQQIPVRWTGLVRGVMNGAHSTHDMQKAIDDCFNQASSALQK